MTAPLYSGKADSCFPSLDKMSNVRHSHVQIQIEVVLCAVQSKQQLNPHTQTI